MNVNERIELLEDAQDMLRQAADMIHTAIDSTSLSDSADAYLIPAIDMAVDSDHQWLGSNQFTVQDAIDALRHTDDGDDPDDDYRRTPIMQGRYSTSSREGASEVIATPPYTPATMAASHRAIRVVIGQPFTQEIRQWHI